MLLALLCFVKAAKAVLGLCWCLAFSSQSARLSLSFLANASSTKCINWHDQTTAKESKEIQISHKKSKENNKFERFHITIVASAFPI